VHGQLAAAVCEGHGALTANAVGTPAANGVRPAANREPRTANREPRTSERRAMIADR